MHRKAFLVLFICVYIFVGIHALKFVQNNAKETLGCAKGGLRLRALCELIRKQMIRGIPGFNIPRLDPLYIDNMKFQLKHESVDLNATVSDATIRHASMFELDDMKFSKMGASMFRLKLNISLSFIEAEGLYDLNALIGDTVPLFGIGKFWAEIHNIKLKISILLNLKDFKPSIYDLSLLPKMERLENNFEGLLHDKEAGELYNRIISRIAPETLVSLWPEIRRPIEIYIMTKINSVLDNQTLATLIKKFLRT